jgi:cytidyltransferase-like protein
MIVTFNDLENIRNKHKDKKIVVSGGTFDLLHDNHIAYIQRAKPYGDIHVVFVNADARVRRAKGSSRPVITEVDRAALIDALKGVDYVCVIRECESDPGERDEAYQEFFRRLAPDIFVSTNDAWDGFQDIMAGAQFILLPRIADASHASTSAIIRHIMTSNGETT